MICIIVWLAPIRAGSSIEASLQSCAKDPLSAAARALAVTQPTVGRHVEALEQALGIVLFTRSQRGLKATESALQLRPYAEALASAAAALGRAASDQGGVKGAVRVTAGEVIGAEVLPSILGP